MEPDHGTVGDHGDQDGLDDADSVLRRRGSQPDSAASSEDRAEVDAAESHRKRILDEEARRALSRQSHGLPRWLFFCLSILLIMGLSLVYTLERVAKRREATRSPSSVVSRMLDASALHHVGLVVANVSRSLRFYTEVLGGQEFGSGVFDAPVSAAWAQQAWAMHGLGLQSEHLPGPWRIVSFGASQLFLWERPRDSDEAAGFRGYPQTQLALRLAQRVKPDDFINAVHSRLRALPDLGEVFCQEHTVMRPEWDVVSCTGPDGEAVQFWRPSLTIAKALEVARKDWVSVASDSRGRDIFE